MTYRTPCLPGFVIALSLLFGTSLVYGQNPQFAAGNWDGDTIEVLDGDMNPFDSFPTGGTSPNGIAYGNGLIFSGHFSDDTVYAYDLDGDIQFSWSRSELTNLQALTFFNGTLAFGPVSGEIFLVDPSDGSDIDNIDFPSECSGLEGMVAVDNNFWLLCNEGLILMDGDDGSLIESQSSPTSDCSFSGTAIASIDSETLMLGCSGGDWFSYDVSSESVIDSGNNGVDMYGLAFLGDMDEPAPPPAEAVSIPTTSLWALIILVLAIFGLGMAARSQFSA